MHEVIIMHMHEVIIVFFSVCFFFFKWILTLHLIYFINKGFLMQFTQLKLYEIKFIENSRCLNSVKLFSIGYLWEHLQETNLYCTYH